MFKRKIYETLIEWKKNDSHDCALLIDGARRVGKSFIVEEFAKTEYKSYIIIDFTKADRRIKGLFQNYLSRLDTFFSYLSALTDTKLHERDSLIIFDEVQFFPKAREAIKTLVADGRYDYVETGSLVSIRDNVKDILIPSEERSIEMYPMDFEEFLWATGRPTLMDAIRQAYEEKRPMGPLHKSAMDSFRQYLVVGGMPQAVAKYVTTGDFKAVDRTKRDILELYRKGIRKHARKYALKVEKIYDKIAGQLSKHEKGFTLASIEEEARFREYESAFMWLKDAMVANIALNVTDPNIGFNLSVDDAKMKCYFLDTGLLVSLAFNENALSAADIHKRILFDDIELNEGMLVENIVAQMLSASGHKLYFYSTRSRTDSHSRMEIDFLLAKSSVGERNNVIPIEVKSGKRTTHRSLDKFCAKFPNYVDTPCILSRRDLELKDGILYLPLYMTPLLP